ncbi:MAG TPA: cytochrome c oxidase subunit 3 [Ilumatobacteraceae bacterium]|jgi:heme/copper-type cytochrome/quinol oxidase subunit 3
MTVLDTAGVRVPATRPGRPLAWWGVMLVIATEGTIFIALLAAYFYTRAISNEWPQGGIKPPDLMRISIFTVVLLASSLPLFWAERAIKRGDVRALRIALAMTFVMGLVFLLHQGLEFAELEFRLNDNAYASLFIVITGLHGIHLLIGLLMSLVVQAKAARGWFTAERHDTVTVFSLYWHFVDVVWLFVFSSLYLSAHIR